MNLSGLLEIFDEIPAFEKVIERFDTQVDLIPLGLSEGVRAATLAKLIHQQERATLFISGRIERIPIWQQALEGWLPPEHDILRFPEPTPLPFDRGPWSDRCIRQRLTVLSRLMAGQHPLVPAVAGPPPLIITSLRALSQKTMPKPRFTAHTRVLRVGQLLELDKLSQSWLDSGFLPVSVVESPGQFSQRGGIIDIFPIGAPFPVRIELFGDEIDTMRYFDPATQRTAEVNGSGAVERILIGPAREALPAQAAALGAYLEGESDAKLDDLPAWQDDIPPMLAGHAFPNLEYYLPMIYGRPASLLNYLPENTRIVIDDWAELVANSQELARTSQNMRDEQESLPPDFPSPLFEWDDVAAELTNRPVLILGHLQADEAHATASELASSFLPGPRFGGQMRPLMAQIRQGRRDKERTVIISRQAQRLAELWREALRDDGSLLASDDQRYKPKAALTSLPDPASVHFVEGSLSAGFVVEKQAENRVLLNVMTDAEIFGWRRPAPRKRRRAQVSAPETPFADIVPGDYIVHLEHGIGLFEGLVVRFIGGMEREYLQLKYSNTDVLYVPVHHADRLSKWVGAEGGKPKLQRLGEKAWKSAKAKAIRAVNELADELMELYAERETISGHAFAVDTDWQAELEASFPYQETEDQLQAIAEVKRDMEAEQPMDRLICGDVGFGKTEVALRAAFKAVNDGKQVAVLVPTTILAQQHYVTFMERLRTYPINVGLLSRFRTQAQQQRVVKRLRDGEIDIVVGTHRLLSADVSFKDLGMLIIDEEQRFGVGHKERFKQLRTEVDVLTMTATPIPRTLHMSLAGMRDISVINTAPSERLPVQTYVGAMDESLLKRAILRELERGGQIYIVHNRVQTIHIVAKQVQNLVPEARVAIGHGQMAERALEKVMGEFVDGKVDILIATTIIENGLDIPNANTLIVDHSEYFGLAQLYQLRGRVGRGAVRAYAYFFHAKWRTITEDAQNRLEALSEHTDLGSGYQIAMRDLEIRGAGELLGAHQSGHIASVGFDLYTKMLAKAVKTRKAVQRGETIVANALEDTLIDLPLATYIPTDYVPDASLRLRLYRRMAGLDSLSEIDTMAEELADRFGPIPDPIDNLLYQLRMKVMAIKAQVISITTEQKQIRMRLPNLESMNRPVLQDRLGPASRVSKTAVWLRRDLGTNEWRTALVEILEKLALFMNDSELATPLIEPTAAPGAE